MQEVEIVPKDVEEVRPVLDGKILGAASAIAIVTIIADRGCEWITPFWMDTWI